MEIESEVQEQAAVNPGQENSSPTLKSLVYAAVERLGLVPPSQPRDIESSRNLLTYAWTEYVNSHRLLHNNKEGKYHVVVPVLTWEPVGTAFALSTLGSLHKSDMLGMFWSLYGGASCYELSRMTGLEFNTAVFCVCYVNGYRVPDGRGTKIKSASPVYIDYIVRYEKEEKERIWKTVMNEQNSPDRPDNQN